MNNHVGIVREEKELIEESFENSGSEASSAEESILRQIRKK